jgi:hypothetical protein
MMLKVGGRQKMAKSYSNKLFNKIQAEKVA